MSSGKKRSRLEAIESSLQFEEQVLSDDRALLLDAGAGLKKREAEGYLVLTDRRLLFGTSRHGILVDLDFSQIAEPATLKYRYTMSHMLVRSKDDDLYTIVIGHGPGRTVVDLINRMRDTDISE